MENLLHLRDLGASKDGRVGSTIGSIPHLLTIANRSLSPVLAHRSTPPAAAISPDHRPLSPPDPLTIPPAKLSPITRQFLRRCHRSRSHRVI
jgi:hypothetical protein